MHSTTKNLGLIKLGRYEEATECFDKGLVIKDDRFILWEYRTGYNVKSVSITPEYIAAGSGDYNVYLFNRQGKLLREYGADGYVRSLLRKDRKCLDVFITSDGEYIAVRIEENVYVQQRRKIIVEVWGQVVYQYQ